MAPRYSSGASMVRCSNGSWTLPSICLTTTCGLPTVSSKPSRRICSTRMASASSPRPCTSQASGRPMSTSLSETLPTSSLSRRSLTMRAVSLWPLTLPMSGEVLVPIVIEMAGSSTVMVGSGRTSFGVGEGLTDGDVLEAGDGDDVAGAGALGRVAVERLGDEQLGDAHVADGAVVLDPGDRLALLDGAVEDTQQREAAEERRGVEVGDVRLQRVLVVVRGRRDVLEDGVEQRLEVVVVRERAVHPACSSSRHRCGRRRRRRERRGPGRGRGPARRRPCRSRGRGAGPGSLRRPRRCGHPAGRSC
jgi:hypothetical protein